MLQYRLLLYPFGLRWTCCLISDDGTFYFDEKIVGGREYQGSLSTTASVVRGLTAFSATTSEKLNVRGACGITSIS